MNRFTLIVLLIAGFISSAKGQIKGAAWTLALDGHNDVYVSSNALDADGNSYFGIHYTDDLDIQGLKKKFPWAPHVQSALLKVSPDGKPLWAHPIRSAEDNRIRDVHVAQNGDILITGFGDGQMTFASQKDSLRLGFEKNRDQLHHPTGVFAACYSSDGKLKWARKFSSAFGEGLSIASNAKGQVYITFYQNSDMVDEKRKLISSFQRSKGTDARKGILILNSEGEVIKIHDLGYETSSSYIKYFHGVFDHQDHYILYGTFYGQIRLSPTDSLAYPVNPNGMDSFIACYDTSMQVIWVQHLGGHHTQWVKDLVVARDNSIYFTGTFEKECVFSNGVNTTSTYIKEKPHGSDFFHGRIFPGGEIDFTYFYDHYKRGYNIVSKNIGVDHTGYVHIAGSYNDTLRFAGPGIHAGFHNSQPFYSRWKGEKAEDLVQTGECNSHFMEWTTFGVAGMNFSGAQFFYGDHAEYFSESKKIPIKNRDHGWAVVLCGGAFIPKETVEPTMATDQQKEFKFKENIKAIQPLLSCLADETADTWMTIRDHTSMGMGAESSALPGEEAEETGVNEYPCHNVQLEIQAIVFPNPARGDLTVEISGIQSGSIQMDIYNEAGKLILSRRETNISQTIQLTLDTQPLAAGIYFIRLTTSEHRKILRAVVVK